MTLTEQDAAPHQFAVQLLTDPLALHQVGGHVTVGHLVPQALSELGGGRGAPLTLGADLQFALFEGLEGGLSTESGAALLQLGSDGLGPALTWAGAENTVIDW